MQMESIILTSRFLSAAWHQVNIDICTHPQHAVDNGAADELFPATARRLTQHNLRHLPLPGDLDQRFGNITTLRADDLGPQIFCEHGIRLQPPQGLFPVPLRVSTVPEPPDELASEGQVALRLDRD